MLLQKAVAPAQPPQKIISLVPSITELLYHLGLTEEVAGITRFCIHPAAWFRTKTKIGGTKNINIKKIQELKPGLIIANKEENIQEQVEELAKDFDVWVTDVNTVEGAYAMINDTGIFTGTLPAAKKLIAGIQKEFAKLEVVNTPLKTAYLIWRNPYMTIGGDTFINDMLQQCGLQNIFTQRSRYPKITVDDIKPLNCDVILLSTEPYPFKEKHIAELQQQLPGTKIILADGEMFSWYGSRMLQMPQYLKGLLQTL
jgi:ABC-type Fe3+-hydroxamate transport system substrate-binding protein